MKFAEIERLEKIYKHDPNYFDQINLEELIRAIDTIKEDRNGEKKHHLTYDAIKIFKLYLEKIDNEGQDKDTFQIYYEIQEAIGFIEKEINNVREEISNLEMSQTLVNQDTKVVKIDYTELDESLNEAFESLNEVFESLGDEVINSIGYEAISEAYDSLEDEFSEISFDPQIIEESLDESLEDTVFRKQREGYKQEQYIQDTLDSGGNCTEKFSTTEFNFETLKDTHNLKVLQTLFYISMGFDIRKSRFYNYVLTKIFYKIQLFNFPDQLHFEFKDFQLKNQDFSPQEQMTQILLHKLFNQEIPSQLEKEAKFIDSMIYLKNISISEFIHSFNYFFKDIFTIIQNEERITIYKNKKTQKLTCFGFDFETLASQKEIYEFINKINSVKKDSQKFMILNLLRDRFVSEDLDRLVFVMQDLGLEDVEFFKAKIHPSRSILTITPN